MRRNREQGEGGSGRDRAREEGSTLKLLLIDNYDSFTYNLAQIFGELGADVLVKRNDEISGSADIRQFVPERICISPGPGRPRDAGSQLRHHS